MAYDTAPVAHNACKIPTDAEELCITAVSMIPAIIPGMGLENSSRIFVNSGTSASGLTAPDIVSIPNINTANPTRIVAMFLCLSFLEKSNSITPTIANICENDVGLSICTTKLLPSIPVRLKIHEVMVVPTLAPMITPIACVSFMIPELTKPTTMTVVADDD